MTLHFDWTYLETQKEPNYWYTQSFFVWCLLRQRNGGSNSGLKPATIVADALCVTDVRVLNKTYKQEAQRATYRAPEYIFLYNVPPFLTDWQGRPFLFTRRPKNRKWELCFCMFVEFRSAVSDEKSKMSQPIRGQGGHLVFPIGPKNTNLVEDVEILLPVKFRWIPFSGFKGGRKCISQSEARSAILFFRSALKSQTWLRTLRSCFQSSFVEFRSAVLEKKSKMWKVNDKLD